MPLLLTQADLRPLFEGAGFFQDVFQVIQDALLSTPAGDLGYLSWLAFPLGEEERRFNINVLSTPHAGTSLRIFPVSGGDIHPLKDGFFALLIDNQDGSLQALLATDDLSPLRTSAPVGLACKYLACPGAATLAMLGSGVQARYHLRAIHEALPQLKTVRVFSPTVEHRLSYATEMRELTGLEILAVNSVQAALQGSEVVCLTAAGRGPLFEASWIQPGALVISITGQGLPADLATRVVVPALEGPVVRPSGWDPRATMTTTGGRNPATVAATLAAVMRGEAHARPSENDVVLYEQRGAYAWDACLLRWIYDWAVAHQAGTSFHLSAERERQELLRQAALPGR